MCNASWNHFYLQWSKEIKRISSGLSINKIKNYINYYASERFGVKLKAVYVLMMNLKDILAVSPSKKSKKNMNKALNVF